MNTKFISLSFLITLFFGLLTSVAILPSNTNKALASNNHIPVTICHATGSTKNPFIQETVDDDAVDGNGNEHSDHNMPGHQNGEDIIPPGVWDTNGRNWNALGIAIWSNSCNDVTPTNTPTPTITHTPTPNVTTNTGCVINCDTPTPTLTTTPTPTATDDVTPTPTPTTTQETSTATPTPTPTTTNNSGSVLGASGTAPQVQTTAAVLGASSMASTGTFMTNLMNSFLSLGMLSLTLGSLLYAKTKKA